MYFIDKVIPVLEEVGRLIRVSSEPEDGGEVYDPKLASGEWGVAIVNYRDSDTKEPKTVIVEVECDNIMAFSVFGEYGNNNVTAYRVYAISSSLVRSFLTEESARMLVMRDVES